MRSGHMQGRQKMRKVKQEKIHQQKSKCQGNESLWLARLRLSVAHNGFVGITYHRYPCSVA